MAMRQLTKTFGTYSVNQFVKAQGMKSILEYILLGSSNEDNKVFEKIFGKKKKKAEGEEEEDIGVGDVVKAVLALFDEDKLIKLVKLGNMNITDEDACQLIDAYVKSEPDNSPMTAFITVLCELDRDRHYFSAIGFNIEKTAEVVLKELRSMVKSIDFDNMLADKNESKAE